MNSTAEEESTLISRDHLAKVRHQMHKGNWSEVEECLSVGTLREQGNERLIELLKALRVKGVEFAKGSRIILLENVPAANEEL